MNEKTISQHITTLRSVADGREAIVLGVILSLPGAMRLLAYQVSQLYGKHTPTLAQTRAVVAWIAAGRPESMKERLVREHAN